MFEERAFEGIIKIFLAQLTKYLILLFIDDFFTIFNF